MLCNRLQGDEHGSPYILLIRIRTKSGQDEAFKREMQQVLERVRQEPACLDIWGHQDPSNPSEFMLYEVWSDAESFSEFAQERSYMREYFGRVEQLWAEPKDLTSWDRVA